VQCIKDGTCRTEAKVIEGETNPLPDTGDKEPLAILTLSLAEQGLYDKNKGDIPVIWSEAPEWITHGSSSGVADAFRVVAKLLVRAEDDAAVVGVFNQDISRRSASTRKFCLYGCYFLWATILLLAHPYSSGVESNWRGWGFFEFVTYPYSYARAGATRAAAHIRR